MQLPSFEVHLYSLVQNVVFRCTAAHLTPPEQTSSSSNSLLLREDTEEMFALGCYSM